MEKQYILEIWKCINHINGYEGLYSISNFGRIKTNKTGYIKKQRTGKVGYTTVNLFLGHKLKTCTVHRLLAKCFLQNIYNKPNINHKNGIKTDNRLENLEWCTQSENIKHSYKVLLQNKGTGHLGKFNEKNHSSKCVIQYDLCGNYIQQRPSVSEVKRKLGFNISTIAKCCLGQRKTSHGYIRSYLSNN